MYGSFKELHSVNVQSAKTLKIMTACYHECIYIYIDSRCTLFTTTASFSICSPCVSSLCGVYVCEKEKGREREAGR